MGLNTAFLVLNDDLHRIANDPKVGETISTLAQGNRVLRSGELVSNGRGIKALPYQHADSTQLIMVGQNCIETVAPHLSCTVSASPDEVLHALADELGYRLSKKK